MSSTGTTTERSHSLVDGRRDDLHRPAARQVGGDLLDRPHRRRQADPLGRPLQQLVEPVEGDRQVRAALGVGDGVHLVDDDRLDAAQRLAGRAGEQQEQRLGGGDEDVGRPAGERAALVGGGVARPDADPDLRSLRARAARRPGRCRSAAPAGCARRRPRAPSAGRRRGPGSAAARRRAAAWRRAGRATRGRPPASCPTRWGRRRARARRC